MGFCEVLTIAFIVLKLVGVISWPWLAVLAPELIEIAFVILVVVLPFLVIGVALGWDKAKSMVFGKRRKLMPWSKKGGSSHES